MPTEKSYTYTGVDANGNPITKTELIYAGVTWTPADSAGNRKRLHFETDTDAVVSLSNGKTLTTLMSEDLAAAKTYTDEKIKDLVGLAPSALDTIGELADALTNNKEIIDTLNDSLLNKLDTSIYNEFINGKPAVGNEGEEGYQPAVPGYSEWKAGVDANILKLEGDIEVIGSTNIGARLDILEAWKTEADASISALKEFCHGTSVVVGTADLADADIKDTDLYFQII